MESTSDDLTMRTLSPAFPHQTVASVATRIEPAAESGAKQHRHGNQAVNDIARAPPVRVSMTPAAGVELIGKWRGFSAGRIV
jgi:hypothetical protein